MDRQSFVVDRRRGRAAVERSGGAVGGSAVLGGVGFTATFDPVRQRGRSVAERGNGCRGWRWRPVRELTPEFGVREFEVLF